MNKTARIAGLWYLLMAITAPIGLLYVPSKLIVPGNPAATAGNIAGAELLFRFGIASSLVCQIAFVFLVFTLYRLFKDVHQTSAALMVGLVVASVPIAILNVLNSLAVLVLLDKTNLLTAFGPDQINALITVFLSLQDQGTALSEIFWGLWLVPFGMLAFKSGFLPKTLGILLLLAGIGYLTHAACFILFPIAAGAVGTIVSIPEGIGEISMVLWLLIKGTTRSGIAAA